MKLQIKIQKIICILALISGALCFIFAIGITTDIYNLYLTSALKDFDGMEIFNEIQPFNSQLVKVSILMILVAVLLFITNTNKRRNYYISNYVVTALVAATNIIASLWAIKNINIFKIKFKTETDFKKYFDIYNTNKKILVNVKYTESTFYFDISQATFIISIIISIILVGNLIWKTILMNKEKRLLANK